MSQQDGQVTLEDYFKARKAVFWHLAAIALSTIMMLIVSTSLIVDKIYWFDVMIFIHFVLLYKSIWALSVDKETPIRTYGSLAKFESNFGVFFWLICFLIALVIHSTMIWSKVTSIIGLLTLLRYPLWLFWLPYVGFSVVNVKRARTIQTQYAVVKSGHDAALRDYGTLKANLVSVEAKIASLKQELSKHEGDLNQIKELEMGIQRLVTSDPANLMIRANEIRRQVESLPIDRVREEKRKIDQEQQEAVQTKKRLEKDLNIVKGKEEMLRSKMQEIKHNLQKLKMIDPANVEVQLQILRRKWASLDESELENVTAYGEIAQLIKERLILRHNLKVKHEEISSFMRQIETVNQCQHILQLKNFVLRQREIDEDLRMYKPRANEIEAEVQKLEKERVRLRAQIDCLEMMKILEGTK